MWQGQRDSNPQPTVLETVALSIALCPYLFDGSHHPCDLYIITNLSGNCKGFLKNIFEKWNLGLGFGGWGLGVIRRAAVPQTALEGERKNDGDAATIQTSHLNS